MARYLVERHLPKFTTDQLVSAARRAKSVTAQMTLEGTPVRYLRSFFIPGDEKCFCLFDGPSAKIVQEANERAELPFERIVEAFHVAAEEVD